MRNWLLITAERFDQEAYEWINFVENGLCLAQIKNKTCHAPIHHLESLIKEIQRKRENVM